MRHAQTIKLGNEHDESRCKLQENAYQSRKFSTIDGAAIVSVENLEQVHERLGARIGCKRAQNEQELLEIQNAIAVLVERREDKPHEFDLCAAKDA